MKVRTPVVIGIIAAAVFILLTIAYLGTEGHRSIEIITGP